jgi:uncharacterized protein
LELYPLGHGVHTHSDRIHGLAELLAKQDLSRPAPVETWDPPYRGDIGLAIRADGTWLYQNSPINRMPLVQLFARVLRRDDDGRYYLVTPAERVDVTVEDAPFLAVEMQVEGSGRNQQLIFRTNVDDIVRCGPACPLRFAEELGSGGLKPYVLVRGRLEALVTRALSYDLVEYAVWSLGEADGAGANKPGIWSGGQCFELTI